MQHSHVPNPDVVFKRLENRMVLVHLATNQIFELNHTGARVWELLQNGITGDALIDHLKAEFDVDPETLRDEVETLLSDLETAGLVSHDPTAISQ